MPGTLEFAIHTLVEERLDMSISTSKYCNDETGRAAYDPKILLKVVLLAYSRGLIFSRKIEQACRENVVFIALACGQQTDHSTIAASVSSMKDEILPLFRDVLLVCEEMNLLGGPCLPWMATNCLPMPRKNGVALFPNFIRRSKRSRQRWLSCWQSRCKQTKTKRIPASQRFRLQPAAGGEITKEGRVY